MKKREMTKLDAFTLGILTAFLVFAIIARFIN